MKLKIDSKSIKFKTFLYFVLFAALLMAVLWTVQIFFLNNFYGTMKTQQTERVVKEIGSSYKHNSNKKFLADVDDISDSYDMYIYVVSFDGKTTYFKPSEDNYAMAPGIEGKDGHDGSGGSDGSDDGNEEKGHDVDDEETLQYADKIKALNEQMIVTQKTASMVFKGDNNSQEILAFATVLKSRSKEEMIAYVFSPLWPVSSTVNILKNQLIIVTIVSLLLACLISFYLSERITSPIRKINYSAKRLAAGEYGIVFKGGHYTEMNDLASTLTGASIELEKSCMVQKDLIANVSHDLRTPLTMIKSYAEMIRDLSGDNPEKRAQHLQVIIDESDRLNNLVEDLLTVSRAQSGRMPLEKTVFSISNTLESVLSTYRVMETEEGYTINFNCPSDFNVEADEEKIKQVLSNLVSNAIKFCGDDRFVDVSLRKHGHAVRISVTDHGQGIAPEDLDHIWERYYRSSSNMIRSTEGSGLGLAICKEILVQHNSDFGVDSTLGKGSTFWFELNIV